MRRHLFGKSNTSERKSSVDNVGLDKDINLEFLSKIMRGVPTKALQVEISRLRQKSIWKMADLLDYSLAELEAIVRPATARSLAQFLPHLQQSPISSPCLTPHLSHQNSPVLWRSRLSVDEDELDDESPSLGSRKVKLHLGNFAEEDFLITLHTLQNLMPFAEREAVQADLNKLTNAGIINMTQITEQTSEELQAIVGPNMAKLLKDFSHKDSAHSHPFLSISPEPAQRSHFFPRKADSDKC